MSKKKITNRKQKAIITKNGIYNAAIDLMDRKGFENITIADISKKAGVSVGAFYHYFKSKNDILAEIFKKADDYFSDYVYSHLKKRKIPDRIVEYFDFYAKFNIETGVETTQQLYNPRVKFFIKKNRPMITILKEMIQTGQEKNQIRTDIDAEELVRYLFIVARGVVFEWNLHDGKYDLESTMRTFIEMAVSTQKK